MPRHRAKPLDEAVAVERPAALHPPANFVWDPPGGRHAWIISRGLSGHRTAAAIAGIGPSERQPVCVANGALLVVATLCVAVHLSNLCSRAL
jgi:hypothetical protein